MIHFLTDSLYKYEYFLLILNSKIIMIYEFAGNLNPGQNLQGKCPTHYIIYLTIIRFIFYNIPKQNLDLKSKTIY